MKIYLLIIKHISSLLDLVFPKKKKDFVYKNILKMYQENIILPSSYHTRYLLPYKNPYIKRYIWNFKYHKHEAEMKAFSSILQDEIIALISDTSIMKPVSLIYPPSSSHQLGQKDFNHMEILLNTLNSEFFKVVHNAVSIRKEIKPQHIGTGKERVVWSKNKYVLNLKVNAHYVICIDDVLTTGNTLKAMNSLFRKKKVFNLTLSG
jgi:predicted amidophosphoribosyltransferase